jgi:hypothetical protein
LFIAWQQAFDVSFAEAGARNGGDGGVGRRDADADGISRRSFGRDARVNALLGAGHFVSHFYQLCVTARARF